MNPVLSLLLLLSLSQAENKVMELRGVRYGEILVVTGSLTDIEATVYNTTGLNDCPADKWKALDPEALKKELKAHAVILNGPRYWAMDRAAMKSKTGKVVTLGGLEMRRFAIVKPPAGSLSAGKPQRKPYTESVVVRDSEYTYVGGRPVYELVSPAGQVYVMQSYSHIVDDTLTEASLLTLANRLKLPANWQYRVRKPDADWVLRTTGGNAHVIQDEFQNSYQRVAP